MKKILLYACLVILTSGCILIDETASPQSGYSVRKKHNEKLYGVSGSEKPPGIDSTSMSQKNGDLTPKPYVEKIDQD